MLRKIFVFLFSLVLVLGLVSTLSVNAYSTDTWNQTDWSGGSGQTNWSDATKFLSSSQINISTAGQFTLAQQGGGTLNSWAQTYGGTGSDYASSIQQTSDGGYVVAGQTYSFSDTINGDAWVLKLDSSGAVTWQKTYGGTGGDYASSIQQTSDGGYIVAGYTYSFGDTINGDAWILKLDSSGAVTWQKTYGGTSDDEAYSIQPTSDGGYIVAGYTYSFGDTINGDAWILKLDSSGAVTWQKTYGGTSGDDYAYSVQPTSDGGYIVAGSTSSFGAGDYDVWVLKLDSSGIVTWQKTYGGAGGDYASSIQPTSEGGYIVAGYTNSFGAGGDDAWVLKLDSSGAVTWQKTYGGTGGDYASSIQQTSDGGYVVAGYTNSFGDIVNDDNWVLKLDSSGAVTWQKTYGGTGLNFIQQTSDGGYIAAGYTYSFGATINGDAWVLKLDSTGSIYSSCAIAVDSTASPASSAATPASSTATSADSTASPASSAATPVASSAQASKICPAFRQNDWSGGPGQINWSDKTKFNTSTHIDYYHVGHLYLTGTEAGYDPSGSLTSSIFDLGAAVTWGPLSYVGVTPAGTSISFEVSTDGGSTWQTAGPSDTFGPSSTIVYHVTLATTNSSATPDLTSISVPASGGSGSSGYYSSGNLTSSIYDTGQCYTIWGPLGYTATTPAQTTLSIDISTNGGSSWQTVTNFTDQTYGPAQTFQYRINLATTDSATTPVFNDISIPYAVFGNNCGAGDNPTPTPTPTPTLTPETSPSPLISPTPSFSPSSSPIASPSQSASPALSPSPSFKPSPSPICILAKDCGSPLICPDGSSYPAWNCNKGSCEVIRYFQYPCSTSKKCIPRPACLDAPRPCMIAEPIDGWCLPSPSPEFSSVPKCQPRPACLDAPRPCMVAEPIGGWCLPSPSPEFSFSPEISPTGTGGGGSSTSTVIAIISSIADGVRAITEIAKTAAGTITVASASAISLASASTTSISLLFGGESTSVGTTLFVAWQNLLFLIPAYRKRRKQWGIVYDSGNGSPVPGAIVKLLSLPDQHQMDKFITDSSGRFILLSERLLLGRSQAVKLEADKLGFVMDKNAHLLPGYETYHQEALLISQIKPGTNLAIPIKKEIPQELNVSKIKFLIRSYANQAALPLTSISAGMSLFTFGVNRSIPNLFVLGVTLTVLGLQIYLALTTKSATGKIVDRETQKPLQYAQVKLYDLAKQGLLTTTLTNYQGDYSFLVQKGSYQILASAVGYKPYLSRVINVEKEGLINQNLSMEKA
jgi:uncharacterized delta-60 repeat protein